MKVHVIQLTKVQDQIADLIQILNDYEAGWKSNGEELYTHSLEDEIRSLQTFKTDFKDLLIDTPDAYYPDKYGNEFQPDYEYAEISYSSYTEFRSIRLLGTDGLEKKRFYFENIAHGFSSTTISLISNIREIIKEPLNIQDFLDLCGQPFRESAPTPTSSNYRKKTRYTWQEVAKNFFVPEAKTEKRQKLLFEEHEKLKQKYKKPSLTKEEIQKRNQEIFKDKKRIYEKALEDKARQKSAAEELKKKLDKEKQINDQKRILNTISKFVDKYSFACILKEAFECIRPNNISCETLFKDLTVDQIFDRLASIFPRGSDTFRELEKQIEENLFSDIGSLRQQIKEKKELIEQQENRLECLKCEDITAQDALAIEGVINDNKLQLLILEKTLKDEEQKVYDDLQFSQRQREIARTKGNLFALLTTPETEEERESSIIVANKVLQVIDTIIPLEDLCSLLLQALTGNFDLNAFKFPELKPINDIFSKFSAEISQAFIALIVQLIITLLETIINELFNCDNLDGLIAAALSPETSDNARNFGLYSDINKIFGGNAPNTKEIIEKNYDEFLQKFSSSFTNVGSIKYENDGDYAQVNLGIQQKRAESLLGREGAQPTTIREDLQNLFNSIETNKKGVLDLFLTQNVVKEGEWVIDFSGEKLVIQDGIRILDLESLDKTINFFTKEELTKQIPESLITPQISSLFARANASTGADANSQILQQTSIDQQQLKNELSNMFSDVVAVSSPNEVIRLLAGRATKDTLSLAKEVMTQRSPLLSSLLRDQNSISNLFKQIGISSGLNSLMDNLELLGSTSQAQMKMVSPKLCAPFDNVESFRKGLMSRVVPSETADKIFENINNEKVKKYNELIDALISVSTGNVPERIQADPRARLLKDIKENILSPATAAAEMADEQQARPEKTNTQNLIRNLMLEKKSSSPIYEDMLRTTLSSIFEPIKDSFNKDMDSFIDSNATTKQVSKKIERLITVNGQEVVNPEYKDFLNAGLVPILKDDGDKFAITVNKKDLNVNDEGNLDDLRVTGNPNTDFLTPNWSLSRLLADLFSFGFENPERVKKPIEKFVDKKVFGDTFKTDIENGLKNKLAVEIQNSSLRIKIGDFESTNSELPNIRKNLQTANMLNMYPQIEEEITNSVPKWDILFDEMKDGQNEKTSLQINSKGLSYNPVAGFEPFYDGIQEEKKNYLIEDTLRNTIVEDYNSPSYPLKSRAEVFYTVLRRQIEDSIDITQFNFNKQKFVENLKVDSLKKQREIIRSLSAKIVDILIDTRLFKDTSLGIPNSEEKVIFLQLFDFVRQPTEEEKRCGYDPHIMDFESLYKKFRDIYDQEPEVELTEEETDGTTRNRTKISNSTYKLLTDVVIRLLVVEYTLKTLPIFDSFFYSKDLSSIPFLNENLMNHVINQMKNIGIYDSFKREFKNQISEMPKQTDNELQQASLQEADCRDVQSIKDSLANSKILRDQIAEECQKDGLVQAVANEGLSLLNQRKRNVGEAEFNAELQNKISENLEQVLSKLSKIFHVSENQRNQSSLESLILESISVYDVHENEDQKLFIDKKEIVTTPYVLDLNQGLVNQIENFKSELTGNLTPREKLAKIQKKFDFKKLKEQNSYKWKKQEQKTVEEIEKVNENDFIFEKYIKIGRFTQKFKSQNSISLSKIENNIISLSTFKNFLQANDRILRGLNLYDCDDKQNGVLLDPPKYGLRLSFVYNKLGKGDQGFIINNKAYGINSQETDLNKKYIIYDDLTAYNLMPIDEQEIELSSNLTFMNARKFSEDDVYNEIFYPVLKEKILLSKNTSVFFKYCIPTREIIGMALTHTFMMNNNEKSKYMFNPTKELIKGIYTTLDNMGKKDNMLSDTEAVRDKYRKELANEGNPAGPSNFNALAMYLRTPIYILKGLATIVDPNVAITDKIVSGVTIAAQLMNQKIFVPYSLTSLALLPFPLFAPGITAYNITAPVGPIFLILEFLLWDLKWFQELFKDSQNQTSKNALREFGIVDMDYCADQDGQQQGSTDLQDEIPLDKQSYEYMLDQIKKICNEK